MSEYIPLEIQAEILKRLPVKPLVQFQSVSKTWKFLIESPDFVVSYGVRHPHPDCFILRYVDEYKTSTFVDRYLSCVDNDDDGHSFVLQKFIPKIPDLIKKLGLYPKIVGSSHGLLCVKGHFKEYIDGDIFKLTGMVILWNPSISKSVGIQVPYIYDTLNEIFCNVRVDNVFGFGVCPVTFDPTILRIKYIDYGDYKQKMKDMPSISVPWEVRVFTLSTGAWSILSTNLPRESISLRGSQVVIDRFIYWVAFDKLDAGYGRSQSRYLIMSFDLTTKEFKEINLTDSLANLLCEIQTISKLRESLVLLEYHSEFEGDVSFYCCCLWMMKEQGDSRSFTKLYTIDLPYAQINRILGFKKTGELILEMQEELEEYAKVQIYKQNYEYYHNLGIYGRPSSFFMCSYMETLLLLDQSNGYIYSNSQ